MWPPRQKAAEGILVRFGTGSALSTSLYMLAVALSVTAAWAQTPPPASGVGPRSFGAMATPTPPPSPPVPPQIKMRVEFSGVRGCSNRQKFEDILGGHIYGWD